jgi:shikimate dehydrogenase
MTLELSGATRLHYIVGDPIAQVKSPAGVSAELQARGHQALCVPAHVAPADLAGWAQGVSRAQNVDGVIVTVPHKFASFGLCASTSERAAFLGAVNVMRRRPDGGWHGDMCDGLGFVAAMREKGCEPGGRKALLVGAGGAGSAIAHTLVEAGVSELALFDADEARREALIARLAALGRCPVRAGSADPTGFDLVLNATPMGMKAGDPLPVDTGRLVPSMFVGCVITQPAVPPLIEAARGLGCATMTGADMFAKVRDRMVAFLLEP